MLTFPGSLRMATLYPPFMFNATEMGGGQVRARAQGIPSRPCLKKQTNKKKKTRKGERRGGREERKEGRKGRKKEGGRKEAQ